MHRHKSSLLSRGIHPGTRQLILAAACLAGSSLESHAELGLAREAYGVWDRTGYYPVAQYPFTRGQAFSDTWFNMNPARNVFNWAPMGAQLAFADAQNQEFNIQISTVGGAVGASMPSWMLDVNGGDVPSLTDGTYTYGYYLDPEFKIYYEEMVNSLANYVRNVVPASQRARVGFVRVDTGATGDEEPYENPNLIPPEFEQYQISHEQWRAHRLWAFEVYRKAFQDGPGPVIPLLFGSIEPPGWDVEWDWVRNNVLGGYGVKYGGTVRGHHLTDSREISDVFGPFAVNPAPGVKLFSRNEMDGTWQKPFFQLNMRLNMYWAAVEQLHAGMSVWDVTGSCLSNTYAGDYASTFEFFNKWAAELIPAEARGGFCIFHKGLDSSDAETYPAASYGGGSVSRSNTARYTAITNAYAAQGAQMDDLNGATMGAVAQRADTPGLTGFNDSGWAIVRGNYDRFITQIDPDNTSKALWRVNGTLTTTSHPYDRFARGFDHASGRNTMYFDIQDNLLPSPGQRVEFTVDYLDRGTGQFALQYDALGNSQKTGLTVTKTNTNTWKTASVVVTDWVCGNNGPNGADFTLLNVDSDDDIFHSVEVTKLGDITLSQVGQGTLSARNDGHEYSPLDGVIEQFLRLDLSVVPAQGWEFAGWTGDLTGTNNPAIIFTGENTQITANFAYTGNYAMGDDFGTGTWSGGSSNWSGPWIPTGAATPGQLAQLQGGTSSASITRLLATPIPNATLSFDWDLDRIATTESGTVEVKVGEVWSQVWTQNLKGTDADATAQLVNATLNLSAYGSISGVRFTLNANSSGERFWIDNVSITGSVPVHAPVFTASPISKAGAVENAAYSGETLAGSATDQNGDPLTYSKVSGPQWLIVAADGTLSGTPQSSDAGANSWMVQVTDGLSGIATATLNIAVANINDAPVFSGESINMVTGATEDSAYSGQTLAGLATDEDAGAVLTYSKVSGPAWLNVAADGTLSGTPGNSNVGANSWTVEVSDGLGGTDTAVLNIAVANVNDAPVFTVNPMSRANASTGSAYAGQTLSGSAADVDAGAVLTYSKVSGPAWLNIATTGALTGTPATPDAGANSWTVQVSDGLGGSANAVLNITVDAVVTQQTATFISLGAEDGYLLESSETSNAGGTVSATNTTTSALRIGDESNKRQYRSVVSFDTSSLPDGATIISATLKLKRGTVSSNPSGFGSIQVDISGGSGFGGAAALAIGDFQAAAGATGVATMSYPTSNGSVSTGVLNATGLSLVNKTGKSQLRVRFATDDDNDNKADYLGFYSGENSTAANRPELVIVYQ